jgi:phosphohistidine phosphatase
MRHGIAEERDSHGGSSDAERSLTAKGRKKMREIADGLQGVGFDVDWIVSSPLARAAQTAEIVGEAVSSQIPLDFCNALRPGGSTQELLAYLSRRPGRKQVLLVGHEPDLSMLASRLIGSPRLANLAFKKGGCCLICFEQFPWEGAGQLVWWLTPRLLRGMGHR